MYLSSVSSRLLLYDTNSWDLKKSYGCYDGIMRDISWSDDSKYILQVNSKGLVEILTAADHDVRSLQHIPIKDTWSASFHRDGHRNVAIGTKSGNVLVWDTKNKTIVKTFPTPVQQSCVNLISYNARNTSLAATMQNGDTIIYGLVTNIPVLTVKLSCSKGITAMKFHQESRSILGFATDEGHIVLRDTSTNKDKVFFENAHASPVSDIAYSLVNKDVMLSSGFDKTMHVYDVRLQNVVSNTRTTQTLTSITINNDNQVALGTKNGMVIVYDLRDLTFPLKILKGHDEEVRKVAFQPVRKKMFSNEISLREQSECNMSPHATGSPTRNRTSEMFFIADSPPKNVSSNCNQSKGDPADSFLVMMGLDKTNSFDNDNRSNCSEKQVEKNERYHQFESDKNPSKMSTPLNAKQTGDPCFPSPIIAVNGIPDVGLSPTSGLVNVRQLSKPLLQEQESNSNIDNRAMEELKDFIKLTVADVADDNRNYFLHIMMALTKQKLFMEKKIAGLDEEIKNLANNQTMLMETNRRLTYEIDQLKAQKQ